VHPLRVESVAWITERKDVLSGMFAMLSLWCYALFVRKQSWWWYCMCAGFLAMGLASKSALMTIPCVLLLLDYWPLRRINLSLSPQMLSRQIGMLALEKSPLFILAALGVWMTMRGGVHSIIDVPLPMRLANVMISYVRYLGKMFWPVDLAVFYPFPGLLGGQPWNALQIGSACAALALIVGLALVTIRSRPYLAAGLLWFLGMMVPVIGLVQLQYQAMADRFTYLPMIGILIAATWMLADVLRGPVLRWIAAAAIVIAGSLCIMCTMRQLQYWRNTDALYTHSLAVTRDNRKLHDFYGDYLFQQKRFDEAIAQFEASRRISPDDGMPWFKSAYILIDQGRNAEAIEQLQESLAHNPDYADANYWLAVALNNRGQQERALQYLDRAIQLDQERADLFRPLRKRIQAASH
jgi:hypothetical protein